MFTHWRPPFSRDEPNVTTVSTSHHHLDNDLKCSSNIITFKRIEKQKVIGDKLPNLDV